MWQATELAATFGVPVPEVGIVNGGVFGYGLDQIVLRAERLAETHADLVDSCYEIYDELHRRRLLPG